MENLNYYTKELLEQFTKAITDQVFLMIEKDQNLLEDYERICEEFTKDLVNQFIGKKVKLYFELGNIKENNSPKSKLIKSYTEHKK